jgi:hypothetical protein
MWLPYLLSLDRMLGMKIDRIIAAVLIVILGIAFDAMSIVWGIANKVLPRDIVIVVLLISAADIAGLFWNGKRQS